MAEIKAKGGLWFVCCCSCSCSEVFWWCDATLWGGCETKIGRCRQPLQMMEDLEGICLRCRAVCPSSYRPCNWVVGLWAWPEGRVVDAHVWGQSELAYSWAATHVYMSPLACLAWYGLSVTKKKKIRELLSGLVLYCGTDSLGFFPLLYKEIAGPLSPEFATKFCAFCYRVVYFRNAGERLTSPPY